MAGQHIIFDGMDGSGKSTLLQAIRTMLEQEGKRVLDVKKIWQEQDAYPTEQDIRSADVIVTAEPSTIWIGKAIRNEICRPNAGYSPYAIAMAFALDREIHYRRVVLPARDAEKIILQDRGISSTLAYQPLQSPDTGVEQLSALPGNALALEHSPTTLVIATLSVDTALERLVKRTEKKDDSIFERRPFLEKLNLRFADPDFRALFTSRGTAVHDLSTETSQAESEAAAVALYRSLTT